MYKIVDLCSSYINGEFKSVNDLRWIIEEQAFTEGCCFLEKYNTHDKYFEALKYKYMGEGILTDSEVASKMDVFVGAVTTYINVALECIYNRVVQECIISRFESDTSGMSSMSCLMYHFLVHQEKVRKDGYAGYFHDYFMEYPEHLKGILIEEPSLFTERDEIILKRFYLHGESYQEIAKVFNLEKDRVFQIIWAFYRRLYCKVQNNVKELYT